VIAGEDNWTATSDGLPEEWRVVDTISPNGIQQQLKRQGNLWFAPDGSMYVYYMPIFWKHTES
jgi:hypothetical protein